MPSGLRVDRFSLWAMLNPQLALLCTGSVSAGTASLLINGLVLDSEALNSPYVNLPINVERSHITSALIDPEIRAEFGKRQPQRASTCLLPPTVGRPQRPLVYGRITHQPVAGKQKESLHSRFSFKVTDRS